jgi:hypothetical protein
LYHYIALQLNVAASLTDKIIHGCGDNPITEGI